VAFWDRLVLLPFDYYFRPEDRDPHIEEKFNTVLPGVLNWFLQGWENYRKTHTIELCETVRLVLNDYQTADDEYAVFIRDCIIDAKGAETLAEDLYTDYQSWCNCRRLPTKPIQTFGKDMAARFSKKRKRAGVVYKDIRIRTGQQRVTA